MALLEGFNLIHEVSANFMSLLTAERIVSNPHSLTLTLHPLALAPFLPLLYKLFCKLPLTLSRALALLTLGSHVKRF